MKRLRLLIFVLVAALGGAHPLCADLMVLQTVEDLQDKTTAAKEQMTLYISGKNVRFDQGQRMSSIILMDRKVTYSIDHGLRKYMVLPHALFQMDKPGDEAAEAAGIAEMKIESTGKSEKISGFMCNQVFITEKDGARTELWISHDALDLKTFLTEFNRFQEFAPSQTMKELEKRPELRGFPLRVIEYRGSTMARRATIERLETKPIPAAIFEIPAGYEEAKITKDEKN